MAKRIVHTMETLKMTARLAREYARTSGANSDKLAFDVVGIGGDYWQVHKHGCNATFCNPGTITADLIYANTAQEIMPQVLDENLREMGYDDNYVRFHNCTKDLLWRKE